MQGLATTGTDFVMHLAGKLYSLPSLTLRVILGRYGRQSSR